MTNDIIKEFRELINDTATDLADNEGNVPDVESFEFRDKMAYAEKWLDEKLTSQKAEIEKVVEGMKIRHELDRELWENTSGGCQCGNCGKQAYEEGEECSPDELNRTLNQILTKIKSLK